MNADILRTLMALNPSAQQTPGMQGMQQQNPFGFNQAMASLRPGGQMSGPQFQQPSWLDALNTTMMVGSMMPQQMPYNPYGGMMGTGQQRPLTGWQRGLQGAGNFLSSASTPALTLGLGAASTGINAPWGIPLAAGGAVAGGLGNFLQYLGQPGMA
jgi:hypothetical protein